MMKIGRFIRSACVVAAGRIVGRYVISNSSERELCKL